MPSQSPADELVLVLSGSDPGTGLEHLFPDSDPKWAYAALLLPDAAPAVSGGEALVLRATAHGPRVGSTTPGAVALWIVLTNAVEGKEAEFNAWYDDQHIHDVVAIPGFVSGQRYTLAAAPWDYLAIYEIELARATESLAEARARAGGPKMPNPGYLAPGLIALPFKPRS